MEENYFRYNKLFSIYPPSIYINTLENFNYIHYEGEIIPRLNLNSNNSQKIEKLNILSKEFTNDTIDNDKEKDIYILIKNEGEINDIKDINTINFNNDRSKALLSNNKTFFLNKDNLDEQLNILLKEKKDIEPIPPKIFISIINDNKKQLDNNNNNNNYKYINKIILDNINLIKYKSNNNISNNIIQSTKINQILPLSPIYFPFLKEKSKRPIFYTSKKDEFNLKSKKYLNKFNRKGLPIKKKIHYGHAADNLLRKIQVHFLSFMVNYINDVIKTIINDKNVPLFKILDYKIKKKVKHEYVNELRNKSIAEILQLNVSPKIKLHDNNVNKNIYSTICKISPFMIGYLQQSYVSLFKEYYYNKNKIFIVDGKVVKLSIRTKTFDDLILKNIGYKEKLKKIAINILNPFQRIKRYS